MWNASRTAAALLVALAGIGCDSKLAPPATDVSGRDVPTQESWDTQVTFSDSGRVRAVLHAGHVARYDDRQQTVLDSGVKVDFYSATGAHTSVLTCAQATVDDRTNNMVARRNVVAVSDSGTRVTTEVLQWDNQRRKLHSDQYVHIASPREVLEGIGFEADQDLRNYVIYRPRGQKY